MFASTSERQPVIPFSSETYNDVGKEVYAVLGRHRWEAGSGKNLTAQTTTDDVAASGRWSGWTTAVHPEGWLYFYGPGVITDHREIANQPLARSKFRRELLGEGFEELVKPAEASHLPLRRVYVNHNMWCASLVKEKATQPHYLPPDEAINLRIAYWTFMVRHPSHRDLPPGAVAAAREVLNFFMIESLRHGSTSKTPFSFQECRDLLEYLNIQPVKEKKMVPVGLPLSASMFSKPAASVMLISWILLHAALHSKTTEYGTKTYYEQLSQSAQDQPRLWFNIISYFCFGVPFIHRRHITLAQKNSELRGDEKTWPIYIDSLVREWSTFNIAATVLLSASVTFLAVPGIDSTTRIATLLSVIMTLGSIITGIYSLWRHQGGIEYNMSLVQTPFQGDALAIILSIPFVLLAWGVIAFLVAIVLYSFLSTQTTPAGSNISLGRPTWITSLASSLMVITLLGGSMFFFRLFRLRK